MYKVVKLEFILPVKGTVSRGYGQSGHNGIDYGADKGVPVIASEKGKAVVSRFHKPNSEKAKSYGNIIILDHSYEEGKKVRHIYTLYAHLDERMVGVGDIVKKKDKIGEVGNTGESYSTTGGDGSHLHFEVLDSPEQLTGWVVKSGQKGLGPDISKYREKPDSYTKRKKPLSIEYSLTKEEYEKIKDALDFRPHLDFKRYSWRMDAYMGDKYIGTIDKDNLDLEFRLSYEEFEKLLRVPPPPATSIIDSIKSLGPGFSTRH